MRTEFYPLFYILTQIKETYPYTKFTVTNFWLVVVVVEPPMAEKVLADRSICGTL